MDARFARLAARAAERHNVLVRGDFEEEGISRQVRANWLKLGVIERLGENTFSIAGSPRNWEQVLHGGLCELGPGSYAAGRSAAALHRLDGFARDRAEFLVPRHLRNRTGLGTVASTTRPIPATDVCRVDGIRCLRPERLILESGLFAFTKAEVENAIDSALRLGLISEQRLRDRARCELTGSIKGGRVVLDALIDAGGHSKLERRFLQILRLAGVPRPSLQVTHRDGRRIMARVDTQFGDELIVEVEGHSTHSTRRQRQVDEQRRTELTLRGKRVVAFTYDDVFGRPDWTVARVRDALSPDVNCA